MFSNWLTPANIQEEFRGNPPGLINPTFFAANAPGNQPVFVQGTSNKPPFGFTFPGLAGTALCPVAPCLDSAGGIVGAGLGIGGIDPNIASPTAYIWSVRWNTGSVAVWRPQSCTADLTHPTSSETVTLGESFPTAWTSMSFRGL